MKQILLPLLLAGWSHAAGLTLSSPLESAVVQRLTRDTGRIVIAGSLAPGGVKAPVLEARILDGAKSGNWQALAPAFGAAGFHATMELPAGGWYRLEVRALSEGRVFAESAVAAVGVGEVFVVAGQSNSANHGAERQSSLTGKVAAFDGQRWQLAHDPQPGASGGGGSFLPPFGDALAGRFKVPVGIVACGIGATSVREWLPGGSRFPQPPTLTGLVQQLPGGEWESKGEAFDRLAGRLKQLGPHGCRAVLWHQGESDANQQDPTRTLPGNLYRGYLEKVILGSRGGAGWDVPWFVAQVTYHVPGDEASPDIRAAQASLWKDGVAHQGPDSDALKGDLREDGGKGVHFSGPGLRAHAARWVEQVAPWIDQQTAMPRPGGLTPGPGDAGPPPARPMIGNLPAAKVLFLGNSITLHDPAPEIGWTGRWGMAATEAAKDYVHLLTADLEKAAGAPLQTMVRNTAGFEREYETFDPGTELKAELEFGAGIVVVAIGENVPDPATEEARTRFAAAFARFLTVLQRQGHPAIFVRSSFWPHAVKDDIMRQASAGAGAVFVDISALGREESHAARSERSIGHAGVAGHPGDKGMRAIAGAIFAAVRARSAGPAPGR